MIILNKILVEIILLILSIIVSMAPLKVLAEDSNYSSEYSKNLKLNNNTAADLHYNTSKPLLKVVGSFFPIYEFVKAVGGDRVQASVLIPVSAEPHDFDPTIQEIINAQSADMVVYNGAGLPVIG